MYLYHLQLQLLIDAGLHYVQLKIHAISPHTHILYIFEQQRYFCKYHINHIEILFFEKVLIIIIIIIIFVCFRGEPLKKKKKLDPAVIKAKEERKKRKLQKRIRMLEKHTNHMKPIFEIDTLAEQLQNEYVQRNIEYISYM